MEKQNQIDIGKDFMLKEYEKMYDLFNLHYNTSEKIFKTYLIIIGAFLTITSYIYKDAFLTIQLYSLNSLVKFSILLVSFFGSFMYLMIIEHRIKTIFYVHNINSIRKWFSDSTEEKIKPYLLLSTDKKVPKYYVFCKDFFWEICVFAVMNAAIISLGIINLINKLININLSYIFIYLVVLVLIFVFHIWIYYLRCRKWDKTS